MTYWPPSVGGDPARHGTADAATVRDNDEAPQARVLAGTRPGPARSRPARTAAQSTPLAVLDAGSAANLPSRQVT